MCQSPIRLLLLDTHDVPCLPTTIYCVPVIPISTKFSTDGPLSLLTAFRGGATLDDRRCADRRGQ